MWRRGIDVAVALLVGVSAGATVHLAHRWDERGRTVAAEVASATLTRAGEGVDGSVRAVAARGVWLVQADGCGGSRQATVTILDVPGVGLAAVTNAHVVAGSSTVELRSPTGERYSAAVSGAARERDVAVLEIEPGGPLASALAGSALAAGDPVGVGDLVAVAGYPVGRAEVSEATVAAVELRSARGGTSRVLIVDAEAVGGSSGGAVVDPDGRFVGLVAARDPSTGRAVAYPADQVFAAVDSSGVAPGC